MGDSVFVATESPIQKYATEGDENTTSYEEATPTEEPQAEIEAGWAILCL
jgi:hypothetical protein